MLSHSRAFSCDRLHFVCGKRVGGGFLKLDVGNCVEAVAGSWSGVVMCACGSDVCRFCV